MARARRQTAAARAQARLRTDLIIQVRTGQLTATAAAQQLGVSRKTFYVWENRALAAVTQALETGVAGRPAAAPQDATIAALAAENARLRAENQHLKDQAKAQAMCAELTARLAQSAVKKKTGSP